MPAVQLPPELVADILDAFVADNPSHAARVPNLAAFAAVSRRWYTAATPLLYRNLYLDSRKRSGILRAFEANDALPPLVRELTLSGAKLEESDYDRLKAVLAHCSAVTHLSYHCFDPSILHDLTWFISSTWPALRYLRADQSAHLFDLLSRLPALETLIAAYIEFPAEGSGSGSATPSPPSTRSATPVPGERPDSPQAPVRPTFRLKRLDSGSSPLPDHFALLTSSSATTLRSLDLPLSSLTSQDLSRFHSLERLTLTLAERYLPLPGVHLPEHPHQRPQGDRDDARLFRRVRRVLDRIARGGEEGRIPLRTLELYEPVYPQTASLKRAALRETDVFAGVPKDVERLEVSTLEQLEAHDVAEVFGRGFGGVGQDTDSAKCCIGVRELVLASKLARQDGAAVMLDVLARRGIHVLWE